MSRRLVVVAAGIAGAAIAGVVVFGSADQRGVDALFRMVFGSMTLFPGSGLLAGAVAFLVVEPERRRSRSIATVLGLALGLVTAGVLNWRDQPLYEQIVTTMVAPAIGIALGFVVGSLVSRKRA